MTRAGKIGGTTVYTGPCSKDQWLHFASSISDLDETLSLSSSNVSRKVTAQPILHSNLFLETKELPTTQHTITARSPSQFHAIWCVFSNMIGVGVRKRPPNKKNIKDGHHVFSLQRADTVHLLDVNLDGLRDDAEGNDWFADDAAQSHTYFDSARNYIRFMYDFRLGEIRITMKAMAIKSGNCDAEPVTEFLRANGIDWHRTPDDAGTDLEDDNEMDEYGDLRIRRGVVIGATMWMINQVDVDNDAVQLVPAFGIGSSITVTIVEARLGMTA